MAGVRIKAKKLGRFDCLLCKGVKGEDITLIMLARFGEEHDHKGGDGGHSQAVGGGQAGKC
jgi:hypothetical protein